MGEKLADGNVALALLANMLATGALLVTLIFTFGRSRARISTRLSRCRTRRYHTHLKKNKTDDANTPPHIPLRYLIAFTAVINETIKPFLANKGNSLEEVEAMHRAWCKAVLLQVALWSRAYVAESDW